jgi:hypothetical protein
MNSEKMLGVAIAILIMTALGFAFTGPKSVKIDSTHFSCTQTEPFGIEARCTQYTYNIGVR